MQSSGPLTLDIKENTYPFQSAVEKSVSAGNHDFLIRTPKRRRYSVVSWQLTLFSDTPSWPVESLSSCVSFRTGICFWYAGSLFKVVYPMCSYIGFIVILAMYSAALVSIQRVINPSVTRSWMDSKRFSPTKCFPSQQSLKFLV